ncbi:hypothetical protein SAMN05444143_10133 [Flavobacterium succinicans]|uniref:Uncharacterized protein n=1 Tax=Flavobacterium succinicans TaxID=29536 RepID=A0A1I4QS99_9FLAO|nr:hypothetical protein SAMN05444143_10133 [Flavobacterium succinicans]
MVLFFEPYKAFKVIEEFTQLTLRFFTTKQHKEVTKKHKVFIAAFANLV